MQALKVTLFSDGRPGHEKQSRGIVKALETYVDVEVREILIHRRNFVADIGAHVSLFFHFGNYVNPDIDLNSDLLIGTGSQTHIPMLVAGRKARARIVTCMTPMSYLLKKFDLCCIPVHDQVKPTKNIFHTVGPPNITSGSEDHDQNKRLILIGGEDDSSHTWDDEKVVSDVIMLIKRSDQISWVISSSPRTPLLTERLVQKEVKSLANVQFSPFPETCPGWIEEQYQINDAVWITGDSISMVYEALSAGCRVGVLPVQWKKTDNKFQRSLSYLLQENLVISLSQYLMEAIEWQNHEPLNEADRCAKEILRRWWPKSIQ